MGTQVDDVLQPKQMRSDPHYQEKEPHHSYLQDPPINSSICQKRKIPWRQLRKQPLMEHSHTIYHQEGQQLTISPDKARKGVIYPLKKGIYALVEISERTFTR